MVQQILWHRIQEDNNLDYKFIPEKDFSFKRNPQL